MNTGASSIAVRETDRSLKNGAKLEKRWRLGRRVTQIVRPRGDDLGRNAGDDCVRGNILCHDRSGGNDAASADGDAWEDRRPEAEPREVLDHDRLRTKPKQWMVDVVVSGPDGHLAREIDIATNCDAATPVEDPVDADHGVRTDRDAMRRTDLAARIDPGRAIDLHPEKPVQSLSGNVGGDQADGRQYEVLEASLVPCRPGAQVLGRHQVVR